MLSFVKLRKNPPRLSFWAFVVTLGSFAPGKPREGSRSAHFHGKGKFFIRDAQERRRLLKVTLPASFAAVFWNRMDSMLRLAPGWNFIVQPG
jgi:hypothetical protein